MGLKDSLLKFLRQDDAPDPEPQKPESRPPQASAPSTGATPASQPAAPPERANGSPPRVAPAASEGQTQPTSDSEGATAETMPLHLEVSPPGHAPQGLAAEVAEPKDAATPAPTAVPAEPAQAAGPDTTAQNGDHEAAPAGVDAPALAGAPTAAAPEITPPPPEPTTTPGAAPAGGEAVAATAEGAQTTPPEVETAGSVEPPAGAEPVEPAAAAPATGPQAPAAAAEPVESVTTTVPEEAEGAAAPEAAPGQATAAESEEVTEEIPKPGPLAPDSVVGERYVIIRLVDDAGATGDTLIYQATDKRSYEQCWSCGKTNDDPSVRFCHQCGAPIQDHPVTLVQARTATGEPGEIEQGGVFFHPQPDRRMFGAEGMSLEIGACSAEGPHHPNEDSYWYATRSACANSARQSLGVVVFGDGMGGYAPGSGLISSRIVSMVGKQIFAALDEQAETPGDLDADRAESVVRAAIAAANTMVLDEIARSGEMGATLVTAVIHESKAYIANIGDSRAYYIDPRGRSTPITRDQSLVAQQVLHGYIAESDIYSAPGNNIILHAVGEPDVEQAADWYSQDLEPGSYILICSDGYWKTLRGEVMPENLLHEQDHLTGVARSMVDAALSQGSDDNTTVILIAIT